jgi:superfamily II DNA or RNA helicase
MEEVPSWNVMKLTIEKLNEVNIRVYGDAGCEQELENFFTYEVPGARFTPKFKARLWDGKVRLYSLIKKTLYAGLYQYVLEFAQRNNYELTFNPTDDYPKPLDLQNYTTEQVSKYIYDLDLYGRGEPIEPRDYQIEAVKTALNLNRTVLLSPTASGKSFMIYCLMRWHLEEDRKTIIVVPTTSLVEQMYSDFEDYSSHNEWSVGANCQKLYSGFTREFTKNVLITTWQSIYTQPKQWFENFDVIVGDEAHQFKATSLITIMERMQHVRYRIGTTGTIDNKKINQLTLEGLFGPVHRVTTTRELMDDGKVVNIDINCVLLKYKDEIRKVCKEQTYQEEMEFLVLNEARNKFIRNLALSCKGNTLVLFQFVEKHGIPLYEDIKTKAPDKNVYIVHGGVETLDREDIRKNTELDTNTIIVASYATFSTGINIPSIENIIFASPTKSKIRNLQSIGRGLRLKDGKTHLKLYDIADDIQHKSRKNHTLNHFVERIKIYSEEKFDYKVHEVQL